MAQRQITHLTPRALAIMDWMLAHPGRSQSDCARALGLTATRVSIVVRSDVYQVELQRRQRLLRERIDTTLAATTSMALDRIAEELERTDDPWFILNAVDILSERVVQMQLGGAPAVQNVQNNAFFANPEELRRVREMVAETPPLEQPR